VHASRKTAQPHSTSNRESIRYDSYGDVEAAETPRFLPLGCKYTAGEGSRFRAVADGWV